MSRTTFLVLALAAGALLGVAVDVADGVSNPGAQVLVGAVLAGMVLALNRRALARDWAARGPVGRADVVRGVVALAAGPLLALVTDGGGILVAVLWVALCGVALRATSAPGGARRGV